MKLTTYLTENYNCHQFKFIYLFIYTLYDYIFLMFYFPCELYE